MTDITTMTMADIDAAQAKLVTLFAEVHAQTLRALEALAEFDAYQGWSYLSYQSCVHWMNIRLGISTGTAREHLRVAHKLREVPALAEAFAMGTLSYSKMRALTRIANAENERELLGIAVEATASQLDRLSQACRRVSLHEAKQQLAERSFMTFTLDGMFGVKAQLMPDEGARLNRLLDQLTPPPTPDDTRDFAVRRADAFSVLCDLAFNALQAGEGASSPHRCGATELVVHVDQEVLRDADADGRCQVEAGQGQLVAVSVETMKRLSCDAAVVVMAHDAEGNVRGVGRRSRRLSTPLKRAIAERDQGCRFPGYSNRIVDVHHVKHWADGGETSVGNLLSLCRFHHTLLHEGGCSVRFDSTYGNSRGSARFVSATGNEFTGFTMPPPVTATTTTVGLAPYGGPPYDWRSFDVGPCAAYFADKNATLAESRANHSILSDSEDQ